MSSTTAIDFESIEAQVRAEAERKVTVLREIVATHTTLTQEREQFLASDAERLRHLSELISEAKVSGFDSKTLKPFDAPSLSEHRAAPRKRTTRTARTTNGAISSMPRPVGHVSTTPAVEDSATTPAGE